jgi:hypothetical protein
MNTTIENMNLTNLEFHELANEFPLISDDETKQLADDIKRNGLIEPIVLLDGKILDGRNRYNASKLAEVALGPEDVEQFEEVYAGEDPVIYVISKNIRRRHLTVGQRAAVAAELFKRMAKDGSAKERAKKAATTAGVAASSVEQAAHLEKTAPEIHKEVKKGKKTLHKGVKEAAKKAVPPDHDKVLERVEAVCGKSFLGLIKEDQVPALTTPKHVAAFAGLKDEQMKQIAPSLKMGWKLNRAMGFLDKELTPANSLSAAMDLFTFRGAKRFEFELDGIKFVLTKVVEKDGDKSNS